MRTVLPDPGYAREAAVAASGSGVLVVHVAWRPDGERVAVRHLMPGMPAEGVVSLVTGPRPIVRRPSVLGDVTVAWAEGRRGAVRVVVRTAEGRMRRFPIGTDAPSLGRGASGRAVVAFERRTRIEVRDVASGRLLARTPAALRATDPAIAEVPDGFALAFEAQGQVWVQRGRGRPVRLSSPPAVAAAPAIAALADGRIAVAWHESTVVGARPDLPRWIALRVLDGDVVRAPAGEMMGRDLERRGEDQGLEFPSLVPVPGGGLVLVARGSHCFYRQDLGPGGWGELVRLSDVVWGCRGRRAAACLRGDGRVLVVRREREGLVAEDLDTPASCGPIPLAPAPRGGRASRPEHVRRFSAHGLHAFFGDLHQHSAHSDGTGTAAERYRAARDRYGDDVAALSDHESFLGKRTGPGEWTLLEEVAERFHEPGRFVTLFAYEWTARMFPGPGHKCVYFPRRGRPVLSRDDPRTADGPGLLAAVRRLGGLAFPHHVGWTGADAASHDPRVQTCWEICSCHGCYEHRAHPLGHRGELAGQFVGENLDAGLRFGFVGASDGHGLLWHHGISRKRDPFRTGLAGILAKELSRGSVWDALRRRRCYATSGAKIGLSVAAGNRPMGSEIRGAGPLPFEVRFSGTARVDRVDLVTRGGAARTFEPRADRGVVRTTIGLDPDGQSAYFYVRLVQEDGEMAWSSPIWMEKPR